MKRVSIGLRYQGQSEHSFTTGLKGNTRAYGGFVLRQHGESVDLLRSHKSPRKQFCEEETVGRTVQFVDGTVGTCQGVVLSSSVVNFQ
jgi:hypothetical protein